MVHDPTEAPSPVALPRFVAVDGLRAWMAWVVVFAHMVQQGLSGGGSRAWIALDVGGQAVDTFIIISGFVITHLLLERPQRYDAYIVQRFMRLFPAFLVCCIAGGAAYVAGARWADPVWFDATHGEGYRALSQLQAHVVAHLTMLHGALPNTVLPASEYAFIPPGWSVSLEWQFYLVAPLLIRLCRTRNGFVVLITLVALSTVIYHSVLKGMWDRPSVLVGTMKFFLIGIACRFAAPSLAGLVRHAAAVGLGLGFTMLWAGRPSLAIWLVVFAFTLKSERPATGFDTVYVRALRSGLEGRLIQLLAERSYSTYLLHWPIIMAVGIVATRAGVGAGPHLMLWVLAAVPLTLLVQEPVYRFVERPGRALGKRWARRLGERGGMEVRREAFATKA